MKIILNPHFGGLPREAGAAEVAVRRGALEDGFLQVQRPDKCVNPKHFLHIIEGIVELQKYIS